MSVVPPGPGDKALLDELFVSVLEATMNVEPHVHREHVDSFFVLDGTFTFDRSGEEMPLEPGTSRSRRRSSSTAFGRADASSTSTRPVGTG